MTRTVPPPLEQTHIRIRRLARVAEIATVISALLLAALFCAALISTLFASPAAHSYLATALATEPPGPLWAQGAAIALLLSNIPIGLYALENARRLFRGYRRGAIFTLEATRRLTRIGWAVVALAPASIITWTLAVLLASAFDSAPQMSLAIKLDESNIYAIVVGLLIVVVGLTSRAACEIDAENRGFV